jgi:DNA-binding beta-propeller fold protein YncE
MDFGFFQERLLLLVVLAGCAHGSGPGAADSPGPVTVKATPLELPGTQGQASLDYLAIERAPARVWIPVGNTGSVDVLDTRTGQITIVGGFTTVERESRGTRRIVGPSSVAIGDGFAYVGDRASNEVCSVALRNLERGECLKLSAPPDGMVYLALAKELWITMPKDRAVTVLDASSPSQLHAKAVVNTPGVPEGYAVDDARGVFFTNLEDRDETLAIDATTRQILSIWPSGCGPDGPRGVSVDPPTELVIVACTEGVRILDGHHGGALLGTVPTGGGVDNIDWLAARRLLYVAAGKDAKLTIVRVDPAGHPVSVATALTAEGARNAVADPSGNAYVADPRHGGVLRVESPK